MITLHDRRGQISGQVLKRIQDIKILADNLNLVSGSEWQTVNKFQRTDRSFPIEYGFCLLMHTAEKEPFAISLTEDETRAKLKSWGHSAGEIENLLKTEVE